MSHTDLIYSGYKVNIIFKSGREIHEMVRSSRTATLLKEEFYHYLQHREQRMHHFHLNNTMRNKYLVLDFNEIAMLLVETNSLKNQ